MEIQEILCSQTGDKCNYIKHPSGLDIYICEMNGFSTTEALFGTKYGSINTMFKTKADKEYTVVPEGIAHFLEHKLFENEDCDAFAQYAKTGANANAYTSFDRTCYLYSCSDNYLESLKILLNFVCATIIPVGKSFLTCFRECIIAILSELTLPVLLKVLQKLTLSFFINATILFIICIIWYWYWQVMSELMTFYLWPTSF